MLGQHIAVICLAHVRREDGLSDGIADRVGGRVPSIVGGDLVEKIMLLHEAHERIVRAIGKVDVHHGDGNALIDDGFHLIHEFRGGRLHHAVIGKLAGLTRGGKGGIHGEYDVRAAFGIHDAADGFYMLGDGLSDGLAFIAGDRILCAA